MMTYRLCGLAATAILVHTLACSVPAAAQDSTVARGTTKFEYTRIDEVRNRNLTFFGGTKAELRVILGRIRNLSTDESVLGVEVAIFSDKENVTGRSIAFSSLASLWGISVSTTVQKIREQGYIFLTQAEVKGVMDFLNSVIGATGRTQEKYVLYKIALGEKFELGMLHDPERGFDPLDKWRFVFTVEGASYELAYADGMEVLTKLNEFHKYMDRSG